MTRWIAAIVCAFMALTLIAGSVFAAMSVGAQRINMSWWGKPVGFILGHQLVLLAFLSGILTVVCLGIVATAPRDPSGGGVQDGPWVMDRAPALLVLVALPLAAGVGVWLQAMSVAQAIVVTLSGLAGMAFVRQVLDRLSRDEGLAFDSHWGGIGGHMGGWRLPPMTVAVLLALLFGAVAIGAALVPASGLTQRVPPKPALAQPPASPAASQAVKS